MIGWSDQEITQVESTLHTMEQLQRTLDEAQQLMVENVFQVCILKL
jgi:hypothetical protein